MRMIFKILRRKTHIEKIKLNMNALGMDVSNFSDKELTSGIMEMGRVIASFGITRAEAVDFLSKIRFARDNEK